ncbi:MAG: 4'-phosphopantetheinyl transferase superfamily protein [Leptolyngbyaceae cyanobacterium SM2_3_12]|nr:4'-phosphopantetheinyl transferase superfamily protein [Leptolyngbyaceae cyanobacterium SM2_3_12]
MEEAALGDLAQFLSAQEQEKLDALSLAAVRRNFLLSRGCLRLLLGRYSQRAPQALEFTYGPQGKPALQGDSHQQDEEIHFNLTHSSQRLVLAISDRHVLGVDVEQVRPVRRLPKLCQRYLTPRESQTVLELPPPQAHHRFLQYWTGKEAYVKALGRGLTFPMGQIELALGEQALALVPTTVPLIVQQSVHIPWRLYQWQLEPDYLAALAVGIKQGIPEPTIRLYHTTAAEW